MAGMMEGKVVVVTGAGRIGREIAIMMAAADARVIINDVGASLTGSGASGRLPSKRGRSSVKAAAKRRSARTPLPNGSPPNG